MCANLREREICAVGDEAVDSEIEQFAHPVGVIYCPEVHLDTRVVELAKHPFGGSANTEGSFGNLHGVDAP